MAKYIINADKKLSHINKEIYGSFAEHLGRCIYGGIYVGEDSPIPNTRGIRNDIIEAFKKIKMPVLRWPGGCYADIYHWMDGIGPKETRKKMINTHWGGVVEDNSFGTHEFLDLCELVGCEPYICGNVGSGTVSEMRDWMEYITMESGSPMAELRKKNGREKPWKIKYWGVGNESWGCGGAMRPAYYADEYRRYARFLNNHSDVTYKIACGANSFDFDWTDKVMENASAHMDGLALHYYTVPGIKPDRGSALKFSEVEYYRTVERALYMNDLVEKHLEIMDCYDPEHKVDMVVDEWGTWFDVEPGTHPRFLYQQNTMRDAVCCAASLNIFNKHSDRISMTNIAQTVNVLQAIILTDGDKMLLTPTYHVYDLYKDHMESDLVDSNLYDYKKILLCKNESLPSLHESASVNEKGELSISLVNISVTDAQEVEIEINGTDKKLYSASIISGDMKDHNTFEEPNKLTTRAFTDFFVTEKGLKLTIPACSVLQISAK